MSESKEEMLEHQRLQKIEPPAEVEVTIKFVRTYWHGAMEGSLRMLFGDTMSIVKVDGKRVGEIGGGIGSLVAKTEIGGGYYVVDHDDLWRAFWEAFTKQLPQEGQGETNHG